MKVAILAGGVGSRLVEETATKPKALVEIGNRPIIWHIMKYYIHFGFTDFVIALGYKGEGIKRWMQEYCKLNNDVVVVNDKDELISPPSNNDSFGWKVRLVETGQKTLTGGRIKRLAPWLKDDTFMLTWCDGLCDVDLNALLKFHLAHGRLATLTAVQPPTRFGHLILDGNKVTSFKEKPSTTNYLINGAYFVLEPGVFDYINDDSTQWEKEPMERLSEEDQLMGYRHSGFWQCMDTLPEKMFLEKLWKTGKAPWKLWTN